MSILLFFNFRPNTSKNITQLHIDRFMSYKQFINKWKNAYRMDNNHMSVQVPICSFIISFINIRYELFTYDKYVFLNSNKNKKSGDKLRNYKKHIIYTK